MKAGRFLELCVALALFGCSAPLVAQTPRPGTVDLSFDPWPLYAEISYLTPGYGKVIALALGPNDEIYMGGHFTGFGLYAPELVRWNGIARLHQTGALDRTFAIPVYSFTNDHVDAHQIVTTRSGDVWAGFGTYSWRFTPEGIAEKPGEKVQDPIIAVYPDGRFLAQKFVGSEIRRYLADLSVDPAFVPFSAPRPTLLVLRNNKVLRSNSSSPAGQATLARHLESGLPDLSFQSPTFKASGLTPFLVLHERANGQVYVAGEFSEVDGKAFPRLVRLQESGALDETFRPEPQIFGGATNGPSILAMAVQPNGKLLIAGDFSKSEARLRGGIARLELNGSIDTRFDPGVGISEGNDGTPTPAFGYPARVFNLAVQRDGRILVGGDFQKFDGIPRDGVVRLWGDPIEPLRLRSLTAPAAHASFELSGTADAVDLEASSQITGPWLAVGMFEVTNHVSTRLELSRTNAIQFYRVRRR